MKGKLHILKQVERAAERNASTARRDFEEAERRREVAAEALEEALEERKRARATERSFTRQGATAAELAMLSASATRQDEAVHLAKANAKSAAGAVDSARAGWMEAQREQQRSERVYEKAKQQRRVDALAKEQRELDDRRLRGD